MQWAWARVYPPNLRNIGGSVPATVEAGLPSGVLGLVLIGIVKRPAVAASADPSDRIATAAAATRAPSAAALEKVGSPGHLPFRQA
jgi:hypothetical protein